MGEKTEGLFPLLRGVVRPTSARPVPRHDDALLFFHAVHDVDVLTFLSMFLNSIIPSPVWEVTGAVLFFGMNHGRGCRTAAV